MNSDVSGFIHFNETNPSYNLVIHSPCDDVPIPAMLLLTVLTEDTQSPVPVVLLTTDTDIPVVIVCTSQLTAL